MMLGQVIGVEAGAVIGFDDPEAVLVILGERATAAVEVVENAEIHAGGLALMRSFPRTQP